MDSARSRSRITKAAAVAVMATAACLGSAFLASPAVADEEHAFAIDIQDDVAPVAPGSSGLISYTLTNTSDDFIDGILFNISLPPGVSVHTDSHCVDVGARNSEGGQMISCQFKDELGKFHPGEVQKSETDFSIAADAPESTVLGDIRALVVPLDKNGNADEDENDLEGQNVDQAEIRTAAGSAGPLDQLRAFFGF